MLVTRLVVAVAAVVVVAACCVLLWVVLCAVYRGQLNDFTTFYGFVCCIQNEFFFY